MMMKEGRGSFGLAKDYLMSASTYNPDHLPIPTKSNTLQSLARSNSGGIESLNI